VIPKMIQRRVLITGRVQGVGFRRSTFHAARKFSNLRGYVRNLPDGRVEAVFAGEDEEVLSMAAWCKAGPSSACVDELEVIEENFDPGLMLFEVR
jgi:acylphosphatase